MNDMVLNGTNNIRLGIGFITMLTVKSVITMIQNLENLRRLALKNVITIRNFVKRIVCE